MNPSILMVELDTLSLSWRNLVETGTWRLGFFLGIITLMIYLVSRVELYAPAKLLWGYALAMVIYTIEFPLQIFGPEHTAFQAMAGANAIEVIAIPLFALVIHRDNLHVLMRHVFPYIAVVELLCVWLNRRGLMIAPSFNCALVALFLPLGPRWLWFLAVPTILSHHAGAAQCMLATYGLVFLFKRLHLKYFVGGAAAIIPALFATTYYHSHGPLLDGWGRIDRLFGRFQLFWLYGDPTGATRELQWPMILFGVGPATFTWISMKIDQFKDPMVIFMHNEWWQIPWELGLTGLALVLLTYQRAVRNAWENERLLMCLAALIPFGLLWHPLRYFPSALLVAIVFRLALVERVQYLTDAGWDFLNEKLKKEEG